MAKKNAADEKKILDFLLSDEVGIPAQDNCEQFSFNYSQEAALLKMAVVRRKAVRKDLPDLKKKDVYYRYGAKPGADFDGPGIIDSRSRDFCRLIVRANKFYTREEINRISFQLRYSVFNYEGGINCRHEWFKVLVDRKPNQAPAKGKVYVNPVPGK